MSNPDPDLAAEVLNGFLGRAQGVFALRVDREGRIVWASAAFAHIAGKGTAVGQDLGTYVVAPARFCRDLSPDPSGAALRVTFRFHGGGVGVAVAHCFAAGEDVVLVCEPLQPTQSEALNEISRLNNELASQALELKQQKAELQEALQNIKTLKSLLPICAWCKKVRDDDGYWHRLEAYITESSGTEFSHGICPECQERMLSDASSPETSDQQGLQWP